MNCNCFHADPFDCSALRHDVVPFAPVAEDDAFAFGHDPCDCSCHHPEDEEATPMPAFEPVTGTPSGPTKFLPHPDPDRPHRFIAAVPVREGGSVVIGYVQGTPRGGSFLPRSWTASTPAGAPVGDTYTTRDDAGQALREHATVYMGA